MKKLLVGCVLCLAVQSQAQTYDWEVMPGLSTSWSVYGDRIALTAASDSLESFCDRNFIIIQNGKMDLSDGKPADSDDTAFMLYRPGYSNCDTLYPGMVAEAVIYRFPGWFHPEKAFRIIDIKNPYALQIFDVPEEPRLSLPALPDTVPDNATSAPLRIKNFFGFPTRNTVTLSVWTGNYGGARAVYLNVRVARGAVKLDRDDFVLSQGAYSLTSLSYWADNATAAVINCPDCARDVFAGGNIAAAVYELPLWWDWSQPFIVEFQGQSLTVNGNRACAAAELLDDDDQGLAAMRAFRDRYLAGSDAGRHIIALYYRLSPRLIGIFRENPRLSAAARRGLQLVSAALQ